MVIAHLPTEQRVTLEFEALNYYVSDNSAGSLGIGGAKNLKNILRNLKGVFNAGQLTAIMGPSGAGKSTLMNILAGYKTKGIHGNFTVNGAPRDEAKFRKMSCYIMQDDLLLPQLTVLENMQFAAELKLPIRMPKSRKEEIIAETLELIGLTECKHVTTGSVSGGQRKRLAIALELINNPPIMFFDEPTSGLDSATCFSCVSLLKSLAQGGRTIICTIHQPSARIFEQFDALYLLSSGFCLYRGPVNTLVPFLNSQGIACPSYHNPADFAIEVASGDYGQEWITKLAKKVSTFLFAPPLVEAKQNGGGSSSSSSHSSQLALTEKEQLLAEEEQVKGQNGHAGGGNKSCEDCAVEVVPLAREDSLNEEDYPVGKHEKFKNDFIVLCKRSFLCVSRDMMLTHLRFASTILVGLLIGALYHDAGNDASKCFDNAGNLFFGLLFMVFASLMTTVLTFPLERGVLIREHLNCWYSLKAYFFARTLADLPFQLAFPTVYILIAYFMTGQPLELFRFIIVCLMAILISLIAQSIGLLIGAACSIQSAVFIAPVTAIPIFLFSGFFVTISAVPFYLRWISKISYVRYAFQTTLTAVYGYDRGSLRCFEAYCHFKNPVKFLESLDAEDIPVHYHFACMIAILLSVRFLSYWALRFKIMSERS